MSMRQKYVDRLFKDGFKYLGGGVYSDVYGSECNTMAVKVSKGVDTDGWWDYAVMTMQERWADNPHVPKIFRLKRFAEKNKGEFYVAHMEMLDHTVSYRKPGPAGDEARRIQERASAYLEYRRDLDPHNPDDKLPAKLVELLAEIRVVFKCGFDLHGGNVMMNRDESRIVVCDPVMYGPADEWIKGSTRAKSRVVAA